MRNTRRSVAILCAALLVGAGNVAAHADNAVADGDGVAPIRANDLEFGEVSCEETKTDDVGIAISRNGNADAPNTFANGAVVTVSVRSVTGEGLSAVAPSSNIQLPSNWTSLNNNTLSLPVTSTVSLISGVAGTGSGTITYRATGLNTAGVIIDRDDAVDVSWNTGECDTNSAPLAPGAPTATSPTQGAFTLTWAPATDEDEDAFTYTLEGKDADDGAFTTITAGLTSPTYTFGAGQPTEGTWTYRVKAVESATTPALSTYSADSDGVVVDRTGPNAPIATPDRAPEYDPVGGVPWWKNTATVSFITNGDPGLPDTSAGSGVESVSAPQTFTATGSHVAAGTATDPAGNVSTHATFPVSVDATAPVVSVDPSVQVIKGSTASVAWTASDTGSGLATPAAGILSLDTTTIGAHTVALPGATDNVGLMSAPVNYTYTVVYDFAGFFQPVDMDRMNVAKAGSAIPIKFSLGGNQGLAVLDGAPQFVITGTAMNGDVIEQTVTAGSSSLSYDATTNQYVYVWKTDKTWAGKAGTLKVKLIDGKTYEAKFSFTK